MTTRTFRPFHWDIYEEHLDEAAFLWRRWEDALVAANFALDDVAVGPEARLLAHLDGLVLGGRPVAEDLLLPAIVSDDPAAAFAASWALVQAEHGSDHQDSVIDVLVHGRPRVRAAVARALALAPRADLARISRLWPDAPPVVRAAILEVLGRQDAIDVRPWIGPSIHSGDPALAVAALRSARWSPESSLLGSIEEALVSDDAAVRTEAIAAGVALLSQRAWDACREAAVAPGDECRLPLGLLATSTRKDDRAVVHASASDTAQKRHAVWALGFAGDLDATEALIEATEDESVARIAGESLCAITGIALGRAMIKLGKTKGPDVQEIGDDDPPPVVRPEDHLALPNARALKTWWKRERNGFPSGATLIQGHPKAPKTIHAAVGTVTMWRREILLHEFSRMTGAPCRLDLKAWSARQRLQWSESFASVPRA